MNEEQLTNAVYFILGFISFAPTAYAAWKIVDKIDELLCRIVGTWRHNREQKRLERYNEKEKEDPCSYQYYLGMSGFVSVPDNVKTAAFKNVSSNGFDNAIANLRRAVRTMNKGLPTVADLKKPTPPPKPPKNDSLAERVADSVEADLPGEVGVSSCRKQDSNILCDHKDSGRIMETENWDVVLCFCTECDYEQEFTLNNEARDMVRMGLSDSVQAFIDFGGHAIPKG